MLDLQTKQLQPDIAVLVITGRITIGRDSQHLEWRVGNLVSEQRKKIIFDLTGVTHVDSTGIGIIMMSAGQVSGRSVAIGRRRRTCGRSIEDDECTSDSGVTPHNRGSGGIFLT